MFWNITITILVVICFILTIVIAIFGKRMVENYDYERGQKVQATNNIRLWAVAPLIIGLVICAFGSVHVVKARTQGVLVNFGAASESTLEPGLHITWPWQDVVNIDTTRQVANYNGGDNNDNPDYHGLVKVMLGNGNYSAVYASVTYQINPDKAYLAYTDFRGDKTPVEMVYSRLVQPQFKTALNDVWGGYNPTAQAMDLLSDPTAVVSPDDVDFSPDFDTISKLVAANFTSRMGREGIVKVIDVTVSMVEFDDKTKAQISALQAEVNKTITARQAVQTAQAQADANAIIAESISKDPNVLASRCFDLIASGDFTPPIGFSCYPGQQGQGLGVIVSPDTQK